MIKVFIPGKLGLPIWRQFKTKHKYIWGNCEFFFEECNDYDYLVVIDSLSLEISTNTPISKRLLFLGEPPFVKHYTKSFRSQFGRVFSCQKKLIENGLAIKSNPILPWMLGCSLRENSHECNSNKYLCYDDLLNLNNKHTINKACLITSNKRFTKGHRDRVDFADYIIKENIDFIDIYGNGFNSISDKIEVLSQYKYSIVIENCSYQDYWTEKLADCLLAGSYPIYYGATNISEYINQGCYTPINIKNKKQSIDVVKNIIDSNLYENKQNDLAQAKLDILNKYNMFALISKIIEDIECNNVIKVNHTNKDVLLPMKYNFLDKIRHHLSWKFNI